MPHIVKGAPNIAEFGRSLIVNGRHPNLGLHILTSTEVCKIIPACLKIPTPIPARQLDHPCTDQSANFGKFLYLILRT